jgi:hypothetical protein
MLFMSMGWDYVSELRPPMGPLFIRQVICVCSHGGMISIGEIEELEERGVPMPLCLPQISRGLTRARTRPSVVRDLSRGTAYCYIKNIFIFVANKDHWENKRKYNLVKRPAQRAVIESVTQYNVRVFRSSVYSGFFIYIFIECVVRCIDFVMSNDKNELVTIL